MFGRWRRSNTAPIAEVQNEPKEPVRASEVQQPGCRHAPDGALARIGLFWSSVGNVRPTEAFHSSGKYVAAAGLAQALARYGRMRHVDLFVPYHDLGRCQVLFRGLPSAVYGSKTAVASFYAESDLPAQLQTHHYDVLHDPTNLHFSRLVYARSGLARHTFPVSCCLMGISYSPDIPLCFVPLLDLPILPCDALVCATHSARVATERRLSDIAERYSRVWDRPVPRLPRLEVIPWGVDAGRFVPRNPLLARRDLDLPTDRLILLCNGRLRIQDKMDWIPLLLIFEHVCRRVKERPLLVLAGSDTTDYGQYLLRQAASMGLGNDVRAFFNLPPASLPSLYAASDVFVAPTDTLTETFGLTIVEAMACGRPVVASDWNGYKELIAHGETGFKVRTHWANCFAELNDLAPVLDCDHEHLHMSQAVSVDVPEAARFITELLQNPALRQKMGHRARMRVERLYDWPVVVAQWEEMWSELAAIARVLPEEPSGPLEHLKPNSFNHFWHFPSEIVDNATTVRLTDRGKKVLANKAPLLLDPWSQGLLKPEMMRTVLTALKATGWFSSKYGTAIGELVELLEKPQGIGRDRILMHLMWLAKYDLVSLGEEGPTGDGASRKSPETGHAF